MVLRLNCLLERLPRLNELNVRVLRWATRLSVARWAPLALRAIVGYGFMAHGVAKLSRGPEAFSTVLQALGVPAPHVMAWVTIVIELVGGLGVLLGGFVWMLSIPLTVILLVAMLTVHLPYGFSSVKLLAVTAAGPQFGRPGYEVNLLYLACLVTLVLGGSGPLALDNLLGRREVGRKTASPAR